MIRRVAVAALCGALSLATPARAQRAALVERWTLAPDVRIGDDETGEAYEFTVIIGVAVSPRGLVHVLQGGEAAVRVFDERGRHVRTIGRDGEGPGEFRAPGAFGFLGDTLWVHDRSLRRVSYFAPDGAFLRAETPTPLPVRRSPDDVVAIVSPAMLLPGGHAIGMGNYNADAAARGLVRAVPWLRLTRAGAVIDTLAWVTIASPLALRSAQSTTFMVQPFSSAPIAVVAASGRLVIVDRDAPEGGIAVHAISPNGDTLWTRRLEYAPVRLTGRVVDSVVTSLVTRLGRGSQAWTPAQIREAMVVPQHLPSVSAVLPASDGSIWLRHEDFSPSTTYTVLAGDGTPRATLSLPRSVRPLWASANELWAAETGSDDVPLLVRYRVVKDQGR
jgi:hypothetical protein